MRKNLRQEKRTETSIIVFDSVSVDLSCHCFVLSVAFPVTCSLFYLPVLQFFPDRVLSVSQVSALIESQDVLGDLSLDRHSSRELLTDKKERARNIIQEAQNLPFYTFSCTSCVYHLFDRESSFKFSFSSIFRALMSNFRAMCRVTKCMSFSIVVSPHLTEHDLPISPVTSPFCVFSECYLLLEPTYRRHFLLLYV